MSGAAKRGTKSPTGPPPKRSRGVAAGNGHPQADFMVPGHRYDVYTRTEVCVAFLSCLGVDDKLYIKQHGNFKSVPAHKAAAGYRRAWDTLQDVLSKGAMHDDDAPDSPDSRDSPVSSSESGEDDTPSSGCDASDAAAHDTDTAAGADTGSDASSDAGSEASQPAHGDSDADSFATANEEPCTDEDTPAPPPQRVRARLPPGWKAWKRRVQKWAVQLLQTGNLNSAPPHLPGYKSTNNRQHLAKIRELLMRGNVTIDSDGVARRAPYRNLHHFRAVNRQQHIDDPGLEAREPSLETLMGRCKIQTLPTLWRQLRQQFPRLRRVKQRVRRVRKDRDAVMVCLDTFLVAMCAMCAMRCPCFLLVPQRTTSRCLHTNSSAFHQCIEAACVCMQACARQVIGEEDVTFPACYRDAECRHCCHRHRGACTSYGIIDDDGMALPSYARWSHGRGYNQWFIDAFKIDPSKMMEDETGIWERGVEQPVQEVSVAHASPGSVPSLTVFIAVHAQHGTRIFYPYNSTGGGRTDSWDGYKWWTASLTEEECERVKAKCYYTMDDALGSSPIPNVRQQMQAGEFNPLFFLV